MSTASLQLQDIFTGEFFFPFAATPPPQTPASIFYNLCPTCVKAALGKESDLVSFGLHDQDCVMERVR